MGEKLDTKLDSYNAWTIKGLERDAVVMICPYTASPKDSDSAILMNTALDNSVEAEEKKAIDLMKKNYLFQILAGRTNDSITSAKKYYHKFWW